MQFIDEGILIAKQNYGETSLILTMFTKHHGIQKSLLKGGASIKNRSVLELGNVLYVQKRAKLEESLGNFKVELKESHLAEIFDDSLKIFMLCTICGLINSLIFEKEQHEDFYKTTKAFISFIALSKDQSDIFKKYIQWEIILLQELGFGLDLSKCVVTNNKHEIYYLSPKTGKAVTKEVGEPYKEKLFIIPDFLKPQDNNHYTANTNNDKVIEQGLNITTYFFNKLSSDYNISTNNLRATILNKALTKS